MGAADMVPGVSGGTIAFIAGIYERWITALSHFDTKALSYLRKIQIKTFWQYIDGYFLLSLLSGIATAIFTLAHLLRLWLTNYPIYIWAFFFGLILASIFFLGKKVYWKGSAWFSATIGAILSTFIALMPTANPEHINLSYYFFCGAFATIAMILPGISGAFILVLLGAYSNILEAINNFNILILSIFALGAIFGLLSFSKLLHYLFKNYHNLTVATMTGFIAGSLIKVWPWKIGGINTLPFSTSQSPLSTSIPLIIIGFLFIFILEIIAKHTLHSKE
ncbi:DUF368 domain-containing protein [Suttonella ornithocola]|uniref:Domain of uncharacterized function (DUF368) n=1 Tax=Suttonella ornithocola TaxID=279832 RepID=A0A380N034_9GAMM|nr:DUF368 domain-containing protein [Suttonella ornithocola]SUO97281.1 Domain of uncharacterised function (DUF368) [Suttonella ornithocola]